MTNVDFGLDGRVVLISGGGSGIGAAVARETARLGARVAILDFDPDGAAAVAAELRAAGADVVVEIADVRDETSVDEAIRRIEEGFGAISGVLTAAGITIPGDADALPFEHWKSVLDVNLTGSFLVARSAARFMKERGGGAIVLISSTAGLGGIAGRANYAATKHGVIGMARSMVIDWGRHGIRVNVVAPGPVNTPLFAAAGSPVWESVYRPRLPLGRMSEPEDQARAITYLLSDYSSYVTGAVLAVDGGLTVGSVTYYDPEQASA